MLFATVALARKLGVDAESALRRTVRTFSERYERFVALRGRARTRRRDRRRGDPAAAVPRGPRVVSEAVGPTRDQIAAARERIAPHVRRTPVLDVAAGTFGVACAADAEARAAAGDRLVQAARGVQPHAHGGRGPRGRRGGERRQLRVGGGPRRPRAWAPRRDLRALELARREDREGPSDRRRRAGDRRLLRRRVGRGHRSGAAETGAVWMHPFDQPAVVAGQGTIGLELSEQAPDADTVLVAVGGGGLIAGIASWFAGHDLRVVGVEPGTSRCLQAAMEAGEPVDVPVVGTSRRLARHAAGRRHRVRGRERRPRRSRRARRRRRDPRGPARDLAGAAHVRRARWGGCPGRGDVRGVHAGGRGTARRAGLRRQRRPHRRHRVRSGLDAARRSVSSPGDDDRLRARVRVPDVGDGTHVHETGAHAVGHGLLP